MLAEIKTTVWVAYAILVQPKTSGIPARQRIGTCRVARGNDRKFRYAFISIFCDPVILDKAISEHTFLNAVSEFCANDMDGTARAPVFLQEQRKTQDRAAL